VGDECGNSIKHTDGAAFNLNRRTVSGISDQG
jgi:hypothetical protein